MGDISAVEAGRLSEIYERTIADVHLEDVYDNQEGPARMNSAQEEHVMGEPNVETEGIEGLWMEKKSGLQPIQHS
ncbi:hypothetical protein INT45_010418 [Circinella minor]|uniref:Uncharacterized protein n=1 Tax=Circinella minor TaxID=1195481 RepID=A0A8H7RZN2_9FUNG|nr:hypothetical protein INT45_010418 [Circinella minor]